MITGNIRSYHPSIFENDKLLPYITVLRTLDGDTENGRYELEDGAYYVVSLSEKTPIEGRSFEAHRRYIDIQCVLCGDERIDYADVSTLTVAIPYNEEKDIAMYDGRGSSFVLRAGDFAVFEPEDAHLPCVGIGRVKKAVVKIPV